VLLVLVSAAALCAAPKVAPLADVNKELASGEFERALKKADAALKKTKDPAETAQLQLSRAQALLALGRADAARAAFVLALKADPAAELDPAKASPDAVRLLDKARGERPATLVLEVHGGSANVSIDEKDMGPAPLQMELPAGTHLIEARSGDGRTVKTETKLVAGRKTEVALELGTSSELKKPAAEEPAPAAAAPPPPAPASAPVAEVKRSSGGKRSLIGLGPLIGGAVLAGAGGVLLFLATAQRDRLVNPSLPPLSPADEAAALSNGRLFQTLGWVGIGVGAAAVVAGAMLLALGGSSSDDSDARLGLMFTPGAAALAVQGRW